MFFNRKEKEASKKETILDENNPDQTIKTNAGESTVNIKISSTSNDSVKKEKKASGIIVKTISSLLALSCVGFSIYCIYSFFSNGGLAKSTDDSFICLTNTSYSNSKKIYNTFGTSDTSMSNKEKIKDYALIGTKLFVSESKITSDLLSIDNISYITADKATDISLYNPLEDATHNSPLWMTNFANGSFYIDLSYCPEGDYLIYPYYSAGSDPSTIYPYSISSENSITETVYSLPDEETRQRKKITIRDNDASPYTVINVTSIGNQLPTGYYDAVIFNQEFLDNGSGSLFDNGEDSLANLETLNTISESLEKSMKGSVGVASSIKQASTFHCQYSIAISPNLTSTFTSFLTNSSHFSQKVLEDGQLKGYDYYPEIREMTGYLDRAGQGYKNVTGNEIIPSVYSRTGKESYLVGNSDSLINDILAII
ncbi:MAG: hypothetical protein WCR67_06820 [Bacilli bacterium]